MFMFDYEYETRIALEGEIDPIMNPPGDLIGAEVETAGLEDDDSLAKPDNGTETPNVTNPPAPVQNPAPKSDDDLIKDFLEKTPIKDILSSDELNATPKEKFKPINITSLYLGDTIRDENDQIGRVKSATLVWPDGDPAPQFIYVIEYADGSTSRVDASGKAYLDDVFLKDTLLGKPVPDADLVPAPTCTRISLTISEDINELTGLPEDELTYTWHPETN